MYTFFMNKTLVSFSHSTWYQKPHLAGGHVFKSYHIFISLTYQGPQEANCGCLPMSLCIYPHIGMKQHIRKGVKEHDMHYKPKSYKLKFSGKSVVQQSP